MAIPSNVRTRLWVWAIITTAGLAFVLKILLALNTYGSNDVTITEAHVAKVKADGVLAWYRDGVRLYGSDGRFIGIEVANHPPGGLHLFQTCDYLAGVTRLPPRFWLRLACSFADIGTLLLLTGILNGLSFPHRHRILLLVAASPVSIMLSGFHGNSDPVMVCLLLLSIWLAQGKQSAWLVGASFGIAMSVKIVPIIFTPVFLLFLRDTRERMMFAVSAMFVFIAGSLPYLAQDPGLVIGHLFGYKPEVQGWGIPGLLSVFLPAPVIAGYATVGKAITSSIILVASYMISRHGRKDLFQQCGCIACLFLFFASGFGVQYLGWLVPWSVGAGATLFPLYYCVSSAFLFTVYTVWSKGFPWFYANSIDYSVSFWPGLLMFSLEVTCWIVIGIMAREYLSHLVAQNRISVQKRAAASAAVQRSLP